MKRILIGLFSAAFLAPALFNRPAVSDDFTGDYPAYIETWRSQRVERLTSNSGWLTIVGFQWLEPGATTFGTDPGNALVIPAGPSQAGTLYLEETEAGGRIEIEPAPRVSLSLDETPITERTVLFEEGEGGVVSVDRISFWIIPRAGRYAVRMQDPESPMLEGFTQIDYYPIDQRYRVTGTLEPKPRKLLVPNIMGYEDSVSSPGPVTFTLPEGTFRLYPLLQNPADSTELFFVLEDKTSGIETYGGGRYFYSVLEPDNRVLLDFNKFYNPPCVFNPFATCPLPPEENRLPVAIRAGEKRYTGPTY